MVKATPQRTGAAAAASDVNEPQDMRQVLANVGIRANQLIQDPEVTKKLKDAAAKTGRMLVTKDEPQKPKAAAGKKRKSEASLDELISAYKQDLDDRIDPDSFYGEPLPTPNAIRGRINRLLDSGIMTKKEFCDAINTTNASLNNFLAKTGTMGGAASHVVNKAAIWFMQRDVAGLKLPSAQKRQKLAAEAQAGGTAAGNKGSAGKPGAKKGAAAGPDISHIHLEGEETDEVPVLDTCDEVRRKISAHLKTTGTTQAQFCRDLYAQLRQPRCAAIQSKQLADFRGLKGARGGGVSGSVFYAAYVYFEKLRVAAGKPKSKHRNTMEDIYGSAGLDRENDSRRSYICSAGSQPVEDQWGQVSIMRTRMF